MRHTGLGIVAFGMHEYPLRGASYGQGKVGSKLKAMDSEPAKPEVNPRFSNTRKQNTELAIQQLRDGGFTTVQMDEFVETLHRMEADESILAPLTNALFAMNVSVQWLM
jgi:hypothetical protein